MTTEAPASSAAPSTAATCGPTSRRSRSSSARIRGFTFAGDLATEIAAGTHRPGPEALDLLDDMLAIREMEEMIVRLRSGGGYEPLPGYDYRGPTHVSIGQEASPVGACIALLRSTTTSPAPTAATATPSPRASPPSAR